MEDQINMVKPTIREHPLHAIRRQNRQGLSCLTTAHCISSRNYDAMRHVSGYVAAREFNPVQ